MKFFKRLIVAMVPALLALGGTAAAQNAFTTGNVNMRVAPGVSYPRITTIPVNSGVTVHGCNAALTWCDTSWARYRGWVSARYLQSIYQGRRVYVPEYAPRIGIPIISFQFGRYWDQHYRNQNWYRDRDRWSDRWQRSDERQWQRDDRDRGPRNWDGDRDRSRDRDRERRRDGGNR